MEGAIPALSKERLQEPGRDLTESWRQTRERVASVLVPFLLSRVMLVALTAATAFFRAKSPIELWNQWDSKWYVGIATHGYHWRIDYSVHHQSSLAFFPMYPLLVRVGMFAGVPGIVVA